MGTDRKYRIKFRFKNDKLAQTIAREPFLNLTSPLFDAGNRGSNPLGDASNNTGMNPTWFIPFFSCDSRMVAQN
jgi:hypothetical protein